MLILSIRTDKPVAELGLFSNTEQVAYDTWQAHRELAETLHSRIQVFLQANNLLLHDIEGIACYVGPGSFTGLRIGLSVANALAHSLGIPIAGTTGDDWQALAINHLGSGLGQKVTFPEYGAPVNITRPKS